MKTTLLLVRHGESTGNIKRVMQGHGNSHLTEKGKKQAAAIAKRLKDAKIDCIYSSDLTRAYHTARSIARYHNMKINKLKELREVSWGDLEGISHSKRNKLLNGKDFYYLFYYKNLKIKNGESFNDAQKRVLKTIKEIIKKNIGKTILVVAHGGVLKILISSLMSKNPKDYFTKLNLHNCNLNVLEFIGSKIRHTVKGDINHLPKSLINPHHVKPLKY